MLSTSRLTSRLSAVASCQPRRGTLLRPRSATCWHSLSNNNRSFQSLATATTSLRGNNRQNAGRSPLLSSSMGVVDENPTMLERSLHQRQQVRWKRKTGQSAHDPKPRRWSKKQKQRFRNTLVRQRDLDRHAVPGSKAGVRREYQREEKQDQLDEYQARLEGRYQQEQLEAMHPLQDPALEYTASDAMMDHLIGNSGYTGHPTPEPIYYGDRQRAFFHRVVEQLEIYHQEVNKLLPPGNNTKPSANNNNNHHQHNNKLHHLLPSDQEIALAIKAYRDRHGTKQKPIGIARALQHVLQDMKIPSTELCFGEYSYNALLSCCRTPKEGLRVFQMMQQKQNHSISKYSWAILMDVHAKVGDFDGCVRVLDEMHAAGHEPNLAAYTSLLAACYKVCNDGRVAHAVRAKAGDIGWKKWQELQIKGLQPDVMCYGSILRLCAARGQPERCMNLLEEMPRFQVAPTTLCFSSALKAIAKSHETAIRYQRGWSPVNRRREQITAHHGKMACDVVLLAEAAKVELDDGFVSALQLCAAAAADSATAKAIYMAIKVRRNMQHWRTIGGEDHLARLRGEDPTETQQLASGNAMLQLDDSSPAAIANANIRKRQKQTPMSFGEREYGKDTRTLSAILKACAQASDTQGVGTMWSGPQNLGYLDRTSLRLIQATHQPSFRNTDVPGQSRTQFGINTMVDSEDLISPRKRTDPYRKGGARKKYQGYITMEGAPTGLYDLPEDHYRDYFDEDGMLKQKWIDTGMYPEYERIQENERRIAAKGEAMLQLERAPDALLQLGQSEAATGKPLNHVVVDHFKAGSVGSTRAKAKEAREQRSMAEVVAISEARDVGSGEGETTMRFCDDDLRWKLAATKEEVAERPTSASSIDSDEKNEEWYFDDDNRRWATRTKLASTEMQVVSQADEREVEMATEEEWYFDADARCWKTRLVPAKKESSQGIGKPTLTDFEARAIEEARYNASDSDVSEDDEDSDNEEMEEEFVDLLMAAQQIIAANGGKFEDAEMERDFAMYLDQLRQTMKESGEVEEVDEMEARQYFMVMRKQFEAMEESMSDSELKEMVSKGDMHEAESPDNIPTTRGREPPRQEFSEILKELKDEWGDDGEDIDIEEWSDDDEMDEDSGETRERNAVPALEAQGATWWKGLPAHLEAQSTEHINVVTKTMEGPSMESQRDDAKDDFAPSKYSVSRSVEAADKELDSMAYDDFELDELRELLPGLPASRLRRVRQAYQQGLSDPSLLTLVPILRETMPDWFTSKSLRAKNARDAHFVFEKASEAGLVDVHVLNGLLQFYTSAGSIEHALALFEEYEEHKLEPTSYSERLVVQMFLKQRRFHRCLAFKQKVEERGRNLDILAYGTLIEYCSKHRQLGSALMFLKECIRVNGAPPGEAYVKQLRILCRQEEVQEEVGLEAMIGEDPIAWKRHGELILKPGKAGNQSHINIARNALLRA